MISNQDLLDAEMGQPPPSTVDIEVIIVRQRRRVRLRQASLVGSVGAMTLAVGLVLSVLPRAGGAPTLVQPGATPPRTSAPPATGTPREREAARLTEALKRLMTAALPNAHFLPPAVLGYDVVKPTQPLVFVDERTYFLAAAQIQDASGIGTITVSVGREETAFRQQRSCGEDPPPLDMRVSCHVEQGSGGAITLALSSSSKYTKFKHFYVEILRHDGNAVGIHVANQTGDDQHEVFRPTPPLTLNETRTLAQAPDLATVLN